MKRHALFQSLWHINHQNEEIQQRGKNLIILALTLVAMVVLLDLRALATPNPLRAIMLNMPPLIISLLVIGIARVGRVYIAAGLMVGSGIFTIVLVPLINPQSSLGLFYLIIPLLMASVTFPLRGLVVTMVGMITLLIIIALRMPSDPISITPSLILINIGVVVVFTGFFALLGSISTTQTLRAMRQSRDELAQAKITLEQLNASLEQRVAERTAALQVTLQTQQEQARNLQAALAKEEHLRALLADVSLPIIPVHEDVLVVPFVGSLDNDRIAQLLQRVLARIETQQVRAVLLDITGISVVDTYVAQTFVQMARAIRLLGAEVLLVGIRPEVAQSLVSLGANLSEIVTEQTLHRGLEYIERRLLRPSVAYQRNGSHAQAAMPLTHSNQRNGFTLQQGSSSQSG